MKLDATGTVMHVNTNADPAVLIAETSSLVLLYGGMFYEFS